jgi:hypothetical protein
VEITSPANGATLCGPECEVMFDITGYSGEPPEELTQCTLTVSDPGAELHTPEHPHEGGQPPNCSLTFSPSSEVHNMDGMTITVTVTTTYGSASDSVTVDVDVRLLYRVYRDSDLMVKFWTGLPPQYSGWQPLLDLCWAAGTQGDPHADSDNDGQPDNWPCSHDPHTYCTNGDHPPRPNTDPGADGDPNNNADRVSAYAQWGSTQATCPTCGATVYHLPTPLGGSFGLVKIPLPDKTAPCGCNRHLLRIHGGGGDVPDPALRHGQGIRST